MLVLQIQDSGIRSLILHMIQLDPSARLSAREYLSRCAANTLPSYFSYLHDFFGRLVPLDADTRVSLTQESFPELCRKILSETPRNGGSQGDPLRIEGAETAPESAPESDVNKAPEFPRSKSLPVEPRPNSAAVTIDTGQLIADISNILGSPNKSPGGLPGSPGNPAKDRLNGPDPGRGSPRQLWPRSVSLGGAQGGRISQNGGVGLVGHRRGVAGPAASIMGRDGAFIVDEHSEAGFPAAKAEGRDLVASRLKATAADAQRAAALAIGEVVTEEVSKDFFFSPYTLRFLRLMRGFEPVCKAGFKSSCHFESLNAPTT